MSTSQDAGDEPMLPAWFEQFLDDRRTRKPSQHTMKAYRQDFVSIATLIAGDPGVLTPTSIDKDTVRSAFADYVRTHAATSIRRCWSTWNVLCGFLYAAEMISANPMPLVGRPRLPKTLPKSIPPSAVGALLRSVSTPRDKPHAADWPERDTAIILTGLLAGLRSAEIVSANVGDIRTGRDGSGVVCVRGKGGKERHIPVEAEYLTFVRAYLSTRAARTGESTRQRGTTDILASWPAKAPLFVGRDGERITVGTLQSRVSVAFKRAGPDAHPAAGAPVHGLRHTFATELAAARVSVYTLMSLLGHESMTTSQKYVTAAGTDTRDAASTNPIYELARSEADRGRRE